MRTRTLGKTEIIVSELGLGTWGLSGTGYGPVPDTEARQVIERARLMGVTLFETADGYGAGRMEKELGEVLKDPRSTVVTKWGTDLVSSPARKKFDDSFLKKSAEESRARLGDTLRVVGLLHNPSQKALEKGSGVETMKQLVKDGVISAWGMSVSDEASAEAALKHEPQVLSLPYNILHVVPLRKVSAEIEKQGTGLLAHSVLFYGLLAGRWAPSKDFRSYDHRSERWPPGALRERIRQLDAVRPLVSGDVTTMRSAAVRFVLENKLVSSAILGPRSSSQLDQLVRECRAEPPYLSEGKLSALEARLKEMDVPR
jgi:aryl-alcohol dehydrogenase-like predicted oxidoreductase